ncbi:MAG: NAD(P)-binding domain-containing protein, partial [Gemmatimonadota bacterium]
MSGETVAVLGAGSWGTALSDCLARNGHRTTLWAWEPEIAAAVTAERRNEAYLPGVELDPSIRATSEMEAALEGAGIVVSVSPSHVVRDVMGSAAPALGPRPLIVSASKGLELSTGLRMSQVLAETVDPAVARDCVVLSGPSFAAELARRLPTAVALAS